MSQTGYWIMGVLGSDVVDALLADVDASAFEPLPSDLDLGWWQAMDDLDVVEPAHLGHGTACPTEPAVLFQEELLGLRPDPDVLDACVAAIGKPAEADRLASRAVPAACVGENLVLSSGPTSASYGACEPDS